jgi:hypothetical protein
LKLKDDNELRASVIETEQRLRDARRDRDFAREECASLRTASKDEFATKLLSRITELEAENEGLTQMVDKLITQITSA